jgi:hypothetical protein
MAEGFLAGVTTLLALACAAVEWVAKRVIR